jgi:cephalosporin-C deacetylase-like acetyl esterase
VPDGLTEPRPGILYIPGHTDNGFRSSGYQNECLNIVHKGFVVLAYDPIGQGERHQEIDSSTGEQLAGTAQVAHYKMHSYTGNQCFLSGVSLSRYFIWDAIRGIDYLVSRPEVDPERIGVTGLSGGGNLTVYTSALDDRVKVAVPANFVTSYRRMLELNGVQDAEQNVNHALRHGIEHADWLLARAPKPTLLLTTTHWEQCCRAASRRPHAGGGLASIGGADSGRRHWARGRRCNGAIRHPRHGFQPGDTLVGA